MPGPPSAAVWEALACPQCHNPLRPSASGVRCDGCSFDYGRTAWGALDLRLPKGRRYPVSFSVGPAAGPTTIPRSCRSRRIRLRRWISRGFRGPATYRSSS
jgi:hypothetical protein